MKIDNNRSLASKDNSILYLHTVVVKNIEPSIKIAMIQIFRESKLFFREKEIYIIHLSYIL